MNDHRIWCMLGGRCLACGHEWVAARGGCVLQAMQEEL